MSDQPPVLIIGGGIGGLTHALALSQHGIKSHILEARDQFSELGAGIQLGPNAGRILANLNLLDDIKPRASMPRAIRIREADRGSDLATLPLIPYMEDRFFAPYLTMRRTDLQSVLLEHVYANDAVTVTTGFKLQKIRTTNDEIIAISDQTKEVHGHLLIGADGIWSKTREMISPGDPQKFSGKTAWRTLIPAADIPNGLDLDKVGLWLGANAHLVHYTVGGEDELNIVAVIDDPDEARRWSQPADKADIESHFRNWTTPARDLINAATEWRKWSLFDAVPLKTWHRDRICLLGDAAHPVLPFLAQGGALAIEDAYILANSINENEDDYDMAYSIFEAHRAPRTSKVQSKSRKNGNIYHMQKPLSLARDLVLRNTSPTRLISSYNWLYGYDVN